MEQTMPLLGYNEHFLLKITEYRGVERISDSTLSLLSRFEPTTDATHGRVDSPVDRIDHVANVHPFPLGRRRRRQVTGLNEVEQLQSQNHKSRTLHFCSLIPQTRGKTSRRAFWSSKPASVMSDHVGSFLLEGS